MIVSALTDGVSNKSTFIATDMFVDYVCNVTVHNAELIIDGASFEIPPPDGYAMEDGDIECNGVAMVSFSSATPTISSIQIKNSSGNIALVFSDPTPSTEYTFTLVGRYKRATV